MKRKIECKSLEGLTATLETTANETGKAIIAIVQDTEHKPFEVTATLTPTETEYQYAAVSASSNISREELLNRVNRYCYQGFGISNWFEIPQGRIVLLQKPK